jgi:hypothetical protein
MQDLLRIAEAGIYSADTLLRMIQEKLKTSNMIERVNSYDERKKQMLQSILSSLINYTQVLGTNSSSQYDPLKT